MERMLDSNMLIDLIKSHPELYAKGSSSNNPAATKARALAWKLISQELDVNVNKVRSRWKSLRDTFQKFWRKARESENESVTISWKHFEKLLFLKDHVGQKRYDPSDTFKESFSDENDPISYDEDPYLNKDSQDNSGFNSNVQKFESEDWSQFNEEDFRTTPTNFGKISFDDEKSIKYLITKPAVKRKSESYDENSSKRVNLEEESDILDKKITQCLDLFKDKLEKKKDSIDSFCDFISSIIKQWPSREQCETIKYLTEYVMDRHLNVLNNLKP